MSYVTTKETVAMTHGLKRQTRLKQAEPFSVYALDFEDVDKRRCKYYGELSEANINGSS